MAKQKKLIDELKKLVREEKQNHKVKSLSIRLSEEQYEAIEIISKATGKTKSEIITEALEKEGLFDDESIEFFKSLIQGANDERDESGRDDTQNEHKEGGYGQTRF